MSRDSLYLPTARTWRDIPQPVVPRAMSREGRWRLVKSVLRAVGVVAVCGALAWGVRLVAVSLQENPRLMPAAAKGMPVKALELRTDGVLDDAWLARTLALAPGATLNELDLDRLRARLLADAQVVGASLTKDFPDRLVVRLTERTPVARVMTQWHGRQQALLVARDGVVYAGTGYDPAVLATLPWLAGVSITADRSGRLQPIAGMEPAAELLAKAQLEAGQLYSTWQVISLDHLASDHRIEVRTNNGITVDFNTRDDFFRQLAKLNYIWDQLPRLPGLHGTIDLSLGRDVPVMLQATPAAPAGGTPPAPPRRSPRPAGGDTAATSAWQFFPRPQPSKNDPS